MLMKGQGFFSVLFYYSLFWLILLKRFFILGIIKPNIYGFTVRPCWNNCSADTDS